VLVEENKKLEYSSAGVAWKEEGMAGGECCGYAVCSGLDHLFCVGSEYRVPKRAASLSFRRLLMDEALSASVINKSGRRRGSKTLEPPPGRRRIVPSRWRSFM
jgi:hypothetical protein